MQGNKSRYRMSTNTERKAKLSYKQFRAPALAAASEELCPFARSALYTFVFPRKFILISVPIISPTFCTDIPLLMLYHFLACGIDKRLYMLYVYFFYFCDLLSISYFCTLKNWPPGLNKQTKLCRIFANVFFLRITELKL